MRLTAMKNGLLLLALFTSTLFFQSCDDELDVPSDCT
jgi:hypothetical protein